MDGDAESPNYVTARIEQRIKEDKSNTMAGGRTSRGKSAGDLRSLAVFIVIESQENA